MTVRNRWRSRAARARELAQAQWALAVARVATWLVPSGQLVYLSADTATAPGPGAVARATRLAAAVDRASQLGPIRGTCLVRAVALQRLMRATGLEGSRIRIGVRSEQQGDIAAHAWVEYGDVKLGEDGATAGAFLPFSGGAAERAIRAVR